MRRYVFPVILGLAGIAILMTLGVWQLKRLGWKEAILTAIEAKIIAPAVPLSTLTMPDPLRDRYLPVAVTGRTTGEEILVLSGSAAQGPGYEVINVFETAEGRRVLLDRGLISEAAKSQLRPPVALTVIGNLVWPNESDSYPASNSPSGWEDGPGV